MTRLYINCARTTETGTILKCIWLMLALKMRSFIKLYTSRSYIDLPGRHHPAVPSISFEIYTLAQHSTTQSNITMLLLSILLLPLLTPLSSQFDLERVCFQPVSCPDSVIRKLNYVQKHSVKHTNKVQQIVTIRQCTVIACRRVVLVLVLFNSIL